MRINWNTGSSKIYNHPDTHYFGKSIRPLPFTPEEFTVAPLLGEYSEQVNIPIYIGATLYTIERGEVIILIFGHGLWFVSRMEKN